MCEEHFRKNIAPVSKTEGIKRISIGHGCSEFGMERMLSVDQWKEVFYRLKVRSGEFIFLGSKADSLQAEKIIGGLRINFPDAAFINKCGTLSLMESISFLDSSDEFWGIDSALLHYARLLGKKTVSFWGPTDPGTRLRAEPDIISKVYYNKIPCSPCIHVAETPQCNGKNVCIKMLFDKDDQAQSAEEAKVLTENKLI